VRALGLALVTTMENPLVAKVLARFPDVAPGSLTFPPEAESWTEKDVELFVGSGGFLKPKKRQVPKVTPPPATSQATTEKAPVSAPAKASAAVDEVPQPRKQREPEEQAPTTADAADNSCQPKDETTKVQRVAHPSATVTAAELPHTVWHEGEYWAPYTTYMEDVGERGFRLSAALNKCERFRNIGLQKGAGVTLNDLKQRFGAGILLREFSIEMCAEPPREIMSALWISLRLQLPCSPFMPMYQTVVPNGSDIPVCRAVFGMLMLSTETMTVLNDNKVYEQVAVPLRRAFQLSKPTGQEGVPKFPRLYPARGRPFRPTKLLQAPYTVMPSDCDMYRVIFHPQMVGMCERTNFAVNVTFREEPCVAFYANLAKPVGVGDRFKVSVFIEEQSARGLYLFVDMRGSASMAAFAVYGAPPGALFSEDLAVCAAGRLASLAAFAAGGGVAPAADANLDLSQCRRQPVST